MHCLTNFCEIFSSAKQASQGSICKYTNICTNTMTVWHILQFTSTKTNKQTFQQRDQPMTPDPTTPWSVRKVYTCAISRVHNIIL